MPLDYRQDEFHRIKRAVVGTVGEDAYYSFLREIGADEGNEPQPNVECCKFCDAVLGTQERQCGECGGGCFACVTEQCECCCRWFCIGCMEEDRRCKACIEANKEEERERERSV